MTGFALGLAALALLCTLVAVLLRVSGGPHLMTQTRPTPKEG
ncbi:hypothetical protein [Nocardiopsis sp. CNT312]|nr:hypothetical protein [Nocardiopsis sp. CNT312]